MLISAVLHLMHVYVKDNLRYHHFRHILCIFVIRYNPLHVVPTTVLRDVKFSLPYMLPLQLWLRKCSTHHTYPKSSSRIWLVQPSGRHTSSSDATWKQPLDRCLRKDAYIMKIYDFYDLADVTFPRAQDGRVWNSSFRRYQLQSNIESSTPNVCSEPNIACSRLSMSSVIFPHSYNSAANHVVLRYDAFLPIALLLSTLWMHPCRNLYELLVL